MSFGILSPGEPSLPKNALIRGTNLFRIVKIECNNPAIEIAPKIDSGVPLPPNILHQILLTYRNPAQGPGSPVEGEMRTEVRVTTDIPGLVPTFSATATVVEKKDEK